MHRSLPGVFTVSLTLTLVACQFPLPGSSNPPKAGEIPKPGTPAPRRTGPPVVPTSISGVVLAPASIVAGGGGNLIANDGASLIGQGGNTIVAGGGGNIVAGGGGNYRVDADRHLLETGNRAIANAWVYLAVANGTRFKEIPAVLTDGDGNYRFPRVPPNFTFRVMVEVKTPAGDHVTLTSLVKTTANESTAIVTPATTMVTEAVLKDETALGDVDLGTFSKAAQHMSDSLAKEPLLDLNKKGDMIKRAEGIAKEEIKALKALLRETPINLNEVAAAIHDVTTVAPEPSPTVGTGASATAPPSRVDLPPATAERIPKNSKFGKIAALASDSAGTIFVADRYADKIWRVDPSGEGTATALGGSVLEPRGLAIDAAGRLYVLSRDSSEVLVLKEGVPSVFAGISAGGNMEDTLLKAAFKTLTAIAIQPARSVSGPAELTPSEVVVFVADRGNRNVRKLATGKVTESLAPPDLRDPAGMAVGLDGTVYVSDTALDKVWKFAPGGAPEALAPSFNNPSGLALGPDGTLYVADTGNRRVQRIAPDGTVDTLISGNCAPEGSEKGPIQPTALAIANNVLYLADGNHLLAVKLAQPPTASPSPTPLPSPSPLTSPAPTASAPDSVLPTRAPTLAPASPTPTP